MGRETIAIEKLLITEQFCQISDNLWRLHLMNKNIVCITLSLIMFFSCGNKNESFNQKDQKTDEISTIQITNKDVLRFDDYNFLYVIKFMNIIYNENGKKIKIPIFQGKQGDVYYDDFIKYCIDNKILDSDAKETGFIIKTGKGELKKTFQEFLNFYKGNILSDINMDKPTKIDIFGDEERFADWEIYYDFEVEDIPFVLKIVVKASKEDFESKEAPSVYQLNPDEGMNNPHFKFSIYSNYKTKDLFHR